MKTINTKQCGSSLGRIALVLKALWAKFHKNTLFLGLWIIIVFVVLGRINYIFNFNVINLQISKFSNVDIFQRYLMVLAALSLLLPWFFNKFVRHSKPLTFASMPANLYEKITALMIYFLAIMVGALGATYLTVLIDHALAPETMPWLIPLGLSRNSKEILEQIFINSQHVRNFVVACLLIASGELTLIYSSIRFKKYPKAFGIGLSLWILAIILFASVSTNNGSWLEEFLTDLGQANAIRLIGAGLFLIDTALLVAIARKLKRIED